MDDNGKTGHATAYISNNDRIVPEGEVSYSGTSLTCKDVYGYVKPSENVSYQIYKNDQLLQSGQVKSGGVIEHIFDENRNITVLLEDEAGNVKSYDLEVDWIDKTPPQVTVEYSDNFYEPSTKEPVTVTITADEPIYILNNYQLESRTFTENGDFTFIVEDYAGNRVLVETSVANIMNDPVLTLTYSTMELTNGNVTVTLTSDVPVAILNNDGSNELVFSQNEKKYFKIEDASGDIIYQFAEVTWIDKEAPLMQFDVPGALFTVTGGSIDLDSGFAITDNRDGIINSCTINHNINTQVPGIYHADYTFTDKAGNATTERRTVEILEKDVFTVVVNGVKTTGGLMTVYGPKVNIGVFNACGSYELQCKTGFLKAGVFKKDKRMVEDGLVMIEKTGFFTIYAQDQERNWKLVNCFAD